MNFKHRTVNSPRVYFEDKGLVPYKECWDYQLEQFHEMVERKKWNKLNPEFPKLTESRLIFCSHPHVYTLGKSGKEENLLLTQSELKIHGAEFYHINRGGDITYHGPGQIVGYPIFDLDFFFHDIHKFIDKLEDAIIATLAEYGIEAGRGPKGFTGVWIDWESPEKARKICAFGMHTSRWVTMHGFALNVNTDLEYYKHIIPCGIDDKAVTSMQAELGKEVNEQEVKNKLKAQIAKELDIQEFL
ncbi:MAG: lipoyl(octanoyl) transferase LipB [Flavobacteriales bacterium]|nr:lipoyl(octanoyl) transferase LipB [Flavobacteriales bacterium]